MNFCLKIKRTNQNLLSSEIINFFLQCNLWCDEIEHELNNNLKWKESKMEMKALKFEILDNIKPRFDYKNVQCNKIPFATHPVFKISNS